MNIKVFELGILGTNCYILEQGQKALIIDPGGGHDLLIDYFTEQSITPVAIVLTHAHFDHIGAVENIRNQYNIPVYIHPVEKDWLTDPDQNGSTLFGVGKIYSSKPAEYHLDEGPKSIDDFTFEVLHTPGHSPGSVSLSFKEDHILIAGDTLFQGSIGRTDLPFGNHDQLIENIQNKILTLPEVTMVYPGHGPSTTVRREKKYNPFLQ
ncbi:MBL fold metallo-hydrolase [Piscibacillus halophilus]|uniref:MBL fold metallo-hydrolase n=1 Tax=Piscibacillus halophilus TaxID=571933 RepID=UPI00158C507E|nr:MBL fold metallo-hydrolase [Piscibacillus halophilus]